MNPFMGLFHYEGDEQRNENFKKPNYKILQSKTRSIKKKANLHIVCLSEWMKEKSMKSKVLGRFPHYVIPNGLDFSKYPIIDRAFAKKQIGITNANKTIMFIAEDIHNKRKGFTFLQDALKQLSEIQFNIITVGGADIQLSENSTHFKYDYIKDESEINLLYSAADLVIIPSLEDNLPNVMLEAFANGTPVLSFNNGGMRDWIQHGNNGLLVQQIDSVLLANQLKDFVYDKYVFHSNEIRDFAEKHFNVELQAKKYFELFATLNRGN